MPRSFVPTGLKHEQIAILIGLASAATLRKHFRKELTLGPIEAQANVRKTLCKLATSGRNPGATMYWLKTQARWSEQGKTPEPVEERAQNSIWVVEEHQPPRTPEQEQLLQEALSGLHGSSGEWAEWEDAPGEPYGISRASPPG